MGELFADGFRKVQRTFGDAVNGENMMNGRREVILVCINGFLTVEDCFEKF